METRVLDGTLVALVAASLLACLVTTIGIYVISRHEQWAREHSTHFMCFAACALVHVGTSHQLPVVEQGNKRYSMLALAAGVLVAATSVLAKG